MPARMLEFKRDVEPGESGFYGDRKYSAGEKIYRWTGNTFGESPLVTGMFVSEFGSREFPFFEVPADCVRVCDD